MTKREAIRYKARLEREGWADVSIMLDARGRHPTYVVSAVDPSTGYRSPWQETPKARGEDA